MQRSLKTHYPILMVLLGILYFLSPSLREPFELIDDHDIIAHYRVDQSRFSLKDFYWALRKTQYLESDGRFRPALFLIKSAQVLAFQKNYFAWRIAELSAALLTGLLFYFVLIKFLPVFLAAIVTMLTFTGIHGSAWMRLLTTEAWGLSLYIAGVFLALPTKKQDVFPSGRFLFGVLFLWFAALTKESFLPLLPLTVLFILFVVPKLGNFSYDIKGAWNDSKLKYLVALCSLGVFLHFSALISVLRTVSPRYVQYSFWERWFSLSSSCRIWLWKNGWVVLVLFALYQCILILEYRKRGRAKYWIAQRQAFKAFCVCAGIWLIPQWIVYGNMLSFQRHYMLPLNLFFVFITAFLLKLALSQVKKLSSCIVFFAMSIILVSFELGWLMENHREAKYRSSRAIELHFWLRSVAEEVTTHPGAALIYFTDAANYEEMESVTRYLREYTRINLKPYLVVDWANTKKNSNDPVFIWLKKAQEKGSQYYEPNRSFVGPSPHSIGIYFSGQMARQPYDKLFLADLFS